MVYALLASTSEMPCTRSVFIFCTSANFGKATTKQGITCPGSFTNSVKTVNWILIPLTALNLTAGQPNLDNHNGKQGTIHELC